MRKKSVTLVLLSCVISSSAVAGAKGSQSSVFHQDSSLEMIQGIFLAQAQINTSTNQATLEDELAETIDAEFLEELVARFLADPAGFIADPDNAGFIAAVVRQALARNPSNIDIVIAAVDELSDTVILAAVADGIVRAAADYAIAGDTVASSQILAKASIATSTALRQAVQTKTSEVTTEITSVAETVSTPANDAPALATTTATTGDGSNSVVPGSGNTPSPPANPTQQAPTNLPPIVTPPPVDSPASPA